MIGYLDVYPRLVAACPSYAESTRPKDADEDNGEFLRVGQVVRHLVDLLADDRTVELTAVFAVVEAVLEQGDDEAVELVSRGFLDDLANDELYRGSGKSPVDFLLWLGPRALLEPPFRPYV